MPQGLKEAVALLAGSGKKAVRTCPPAAGEGAGRAAPLLSCSQQWPWGPPALLPAPTPHLDTHAPRLTHALLLASSSLPATAAALSLPTACLVSPDTHPIQGPLCRRGECGVCMCCWAVLLMLSGPPDQGISEGRRKPACLVTCLWVG